MSAFDNISVEKRATLARLTVNRPKALAAFMGKSRAQGSGSLREHVATLAKDPSGVVSRTYARLLELEESYANLPLSVREDILQFLQCCSRLWLDTLGTAS